ncbi:hypothetical protein GCM10009555_045810 [Acrocarpospora macrocephala]|uniref:Uncharacterized protein n=1 Tax=Acrocarpospora macrocephala TaxID=150177 RepID=A0A5M3WD57_9ACTN|nr:hypothetical protein Amac_003510 [Acrocarpospora macrocephala]
MNGVITSVAHWLDSRPGSLVAHAGVEANMTSASRRRPTAAVKEAEPQGLRSHIFPTIAHFRHQDAG